MLAYEVEELLKKEFEGAITGDHIQYFYEEGWIEQVVDEKQDVNWLVSKVRRYLESIGRNPPERQIRFVSKMSKDSMTRDEARSKILAYMAAQEPDVVEFRKVHFKDQLISFTEALEDWLKKTLDQDSARFGQKNLTPGQKRDFLDYLIPADEWIRRLPIVPGGVLAGIDRIATALSEKFDFQKVQAVIFLLTGRAPWVASIRVRRSLPFFPGDEEACNKKVVLTVNTAVTSHELAAFYRRLKKRMGLNRRVKNLTPKHLQLAVLACEREKAGKSWAVAFREWNKTVKLKKDRYSQESNFRRDALKARARLMSL